MEGSHTSQKCEGQKIHPSLDVVLATLVRTTSLRDQDGLSAIKNLEVCTLRLKTVIDWQKCVVTYRHMLSCHSSPISSPDRLWSTISCRPQLDSGSSYCTARLPVLFQHFACAYVVPGSPSVGTSFLIWSQRCFLCRFHLSLSGSLLGRWKYALSCNSCWWVVDNMLWRNSTDVCLLYECNILIINISGGPNFQIHFGWSRVSLRNETLCYYEMINGMTTREVIQTHKTAWIHPWNLWYSYLCGWNPT